MSRLRRFLGMDALDLVIHVGVTLALLFFVGVSDGPEELYPLLVGGSLIMLGVRRAIHLHFAERRSLSSDEMAIERITDLEQRMAELEAEQARVAALEERLDFTERLLARASVEQRIGGPGAPG